MRGLAAPAEALCRAQIRAIGTVPTLRNSITGYDPGLSTRAEEMIASWMLIVARSTCWRPRKIGWQETSLGTAFSDVDSFLGGVLAELRGGTPPSPAAVRAVTSPSRNGAPGTPRGMSIVWSVNSRNWS